MQLDFRDLEARVRVELVAAPAFFGDSMLGSGTGGPESGWVEQVLETYDNDMPSAGIAQGGAPEEQIFEWVLTQSHGDRERIQIVWPGAIQGNPGDLEDLATRADRYVEKSGDILDLIPHDRVLILGPHTADASYLFAGANQRAFHDQVRTDLGTEFPQAFLDIEAFLTATYLDTPEDQQDQLNGIVPTSLRQDGVHLDDAGHDVVTDAVLERLEAFDRFDFGLAITGPGEDDFEKFDVGAFDTVHGSPFDDEIFGDRGHQVLFGEDGNDLIRGLSGDDEIHGGAGDDRLDPGEGMDILTGGEGADLFLFELGEGRNRITDFDYDEDRMSILELGRDLAAYRGGTRAGPDSDWWIFEVDGEFLSISGIDWDLFEYGNTWHDGGNPWG